MKLWLWFAALILTSVGAVSADGWVSVKSPMSDGRWAPAATVLADGETGLILGGYSFTAHRCVATADLFDSVQQRFTLCRGRLTVPRNFAAALLLPNHTVLIAGGYNTVWGSLDSAEIYNPLTETFHLIPARLTTPRELFTATPLTDGRILFVGGFDTGVGKTQASADLYDPANQSFSYTASLHEDRFGHAAARLADGRVLVVGGTHWFVGQSGQALALAEIYDPVTGRFQTTREPMHFPRDRPTANLLPDGTVLIAGGQNSAGEPTQVEVFHPATETFTLLSSALITPRMAHSAGVLPDGRVIIAGGWSAPIQATTAATELFDPQIQRFTPAPTLGASSHDLALLIFPNGLILAAGGKHVQNGRERSLETGCTYQPVKLQTP